MMNIKSHKINIPSQVIGKNWGVYSQKYQKIESMLENSLIFPNSKLKKYLHSTGAFQLPISEFNKLPNDYLTDYFVVDTTNKLFIKLKTKVVFRGLDYFVGVQSISNLDKLEVIFIRLLKMLNLLDDVKANSNIILYLSLLDYIRNYLMILLYAIHQSTRELGVQKELRHPYEVFSELINQIEKTYMESLMTNKIFTQSTYKVFVPYLLLIKIYLLKSVSLVDYNQTLSDDMVRRIRECNNPIKIFNFAKKISSKYLPNKTMLIGLEYGGIELPFAVNALRSIFGKSVLDVATVSLSSYSTGSNRYVDFVQDALSPFFLFEKLENYNCIVILDDSITTGRTVDYLVKLLPKNIESVYFFAVSFTNTNRYHHLTRYEHGGVNPIILSGGNVVYKSNFTQTYSRNSYTNKQGVFDKEKSCILRMLKEYYPNLAN